MKEWRRGENVQGSEGDGGTAVGVGGKEVDLERKRVLRKI